MPVLTHQCSECWPLTTKYDNLLETLEIRLLRKIMGQLRKVVYVDHGLIVNCINYIMKQKQRKSSAQEYRGGRNISVECRNITLPEI